MYERMFDPTTKDMYKTRGKRLKIEWSGGAGVWNPSLNRAPDDEQYYKCSKE